MVKKKRVLALLLSCAITLTSIGLTGSSKTYAEVSANDFDVNTAWTMSNNIGTKFTVKNGAGAYSTGKSKIGDVGVTATFVKQADRNDGASYLSDNGNNQAAYGATDDMFYGNPDPGSIPALGMNTQPSNGCGGPLGSWQKYNADKEYEVGSVTFKFAKKVTDPILDLSGLGGYVSRVGSYNYNGNMILVGMGSFNTTNLHLATKGITLENVASNSNLTTDNNIIKVKDRNTHTRAIVDNGGYNWIQFKDGYGRQYDVNSPALVPAGTGSVKLKGTFDEVTFKLYHQATPYSKFSQEKYKTHSSYFANHAGADPSHGDGINGMNVINTESVHIGGQYFNGDQNWDLFRVSLRLPKTSSIGDKVWLDENANGTQDAGEKGVEGVTVKLLDKDGNPAKDFNGNPVADQVTDANGNYKFENLAAGEYVVQVVPQDGQTLTTKGQGDADTDSDVDTTTGKTDVITLEQNTNITNVDAGIVPEKEYKVDYEFQPSKEAGTPSELPKEVKDQLPKAKEKLADGTEVASPKEFTKVKDEVNKGTWTFEKWDKETATIKGADEHVIGTWKFTKDEEPKPEEHKVTHEFKSGTTGKDLPDEVKALLPKEQTGKTDGTTVVPTEPAQKEVTTAEGTWTFKGYDRTNATIDGKDEHFVGTWEFTPKEQPKPETGSVYVKYVTEDGKVLEKESEVLVNEKVGTPYKTEQKTFEGYEFVKLEEGSAPANGEVKKGDQHVTYVYRPVQPKEYKLDYEFKPSDAEGTPDKLPQGVLDQLPKAKENLKDGTEVPSPKEFTKVKDEVNKGTWTFEKWDKETAKINGADEHVTGTWVFTKDPEKEYKLDYKFKPSDAEGTPKTLPKEVLAQLPEAKEKLKDGTEVASPKDFKEVRDEANKGTWTFEAWDKETAKINGADEHVTGTWVFTKDPEKEYKVTHEFKSGTDGKDLPEEVNKLRPADQTGKKDGEKVTPTQPEKTEVAVEGGKWIFKNYDKTDATIDKADEHFVGTWVFEEDKTPEPEKEYKVTHEFKSGTPEKELPEEVNKLRPADQTGKKDGEEVTPTQPEKTEVPVKGGKWVFKNYDKKDATIDKADKNFVGTWVFEENKPEPEKEYKVTHDFKSGTVGKDLPEEVKALIPADQTGKKDGDKVTPTQPAKTEVAVEGGKWVFKNYDKTDATIDKADEHFVGTWVFEEDKTPEPEDVVTKYVDENGKTIADKENGTKDKKDIPGYEFVETKTDEKGNTKHIYKKVTPPTDVVTEYVDEDGKTISDKENGTKDKKDIRGYEFVKTEKDEKGNTKHIYKKVKPTPEVVTEYVDEDGNTISDKENGTKDKKDIKGYEFVKTEKDEKGNTKHIYKKKTTPPTTEVVTKFVDENGNPLALEEKGKQNKKDIPAYEYVKTYTDKDGNTVHVYRLKQNPTPSVETRYVDENGNKLLPPKEGTKNPENIDGYKFINTIKDENGNTIHIYSKNPTEDVETRYVDTDGNQILADKAGTHDPSLINGYEFVRTEIDEQGNTTHIYRKIPTPSKEVVTKFLDENGIELASPLKGRNPSKEIPGYEIITTITDDKGNLIYVYRKKPDSIKVVTKFVDEKGNPVAESEDGKKPKKDIKGYEFVKTEKDKDGNTVHIYRRKTPTPTVDKITKFVDENGNKISESTKGDNPKKDIDGYEFVKTEKDKDGNTVHIYKKKENTSKVVTKFVDEKGNTIAESEDGKKPNKDIKGYEFVKTEKDKDGNTVHIYKKKTNTRVIIQGNRTINSSSPNKKGTLVNTGDGVNASTYAIMMLAIGAVLTAIGIRKKKKEA
ncbi:MAG: SHIRT domain-containing protein [Finegoldia magna]|nr:SHIRT domain-containing protein [Finegoldia magna]MDU5369581.1 SHIRT domain-containing protein [Finegoldia magna]